MKKKVGYLIGVWGVFLLLNVSPSWAQGDAGDYLTITGMVKDKENNKKLENVNISISGSNVATVTNADGQFSLKVKTSEIVKDLEVSHIGYQNMHVSLENMSSRHENTPDLIVWMTPHTNLLNEVVVYANNPRFIIEEAIKKIPVNYSSKNNLLTGFYRETVQKGRRYISLSEAVVDVFKTKYDYRNADHDKVQIHRGRRLLSPKTSDTLAVKVQGGPNQSVYLDVVKNEDALLNKDALRFYDFQMEEPISIANRQQYVIRFYPKVLLTYALFHGKLYIDREKLSLTRAEFNLDLTNKEKAIQAILYKKPVGLRFKPQEVSYLVTYKNQGDKTYLNYICNAMRFKCDWKRRLFASGYTVFSEMVVTDRKEIDVSDAISNREAFKPQQIFYDKVDEYWNEDFWGNYNIIEPTESLEQAVDKLKKQSR